MKPLIRAASILSPEPEHWWTADGRDIAQLEGYLREVAPPLDDASPSWHGELRSGAMYELTASSQPLVAPDQVTVNVRAAPEGWPQRAEAG